ncbi:hypothetical protein DRQ25_01685 [Candidatus Fermentibacteria bacterium]|nr:MAG: hypothetical protein DRQ25_01685 [Candidatus Fermentibacteria bacterium]
MQALLTRTQFRESVFERDHNTCVGCEDIAADAHHIIERRLFHNGGYYLNNGAALCHNCHLEAEMTMLSCDVLRARARIEHVILPEGFDRNTNYDKWGNIILLTGRRVKGPLFDDRSVQKILQRGGMLRLFL